MEQKQYTCIVCPRSCVGTLTIADDGSMSTAGFQCPNGEKYAKNEYVDPKRVLTTTVKIKNAIYPLLPVVSTEEISRKVFNDCLKVLYEVSVEAPLSQGDVIVENICGTGIDIIAARTLAKIK